MTQRVRVGPRCATSVTMIHLLVILGVVKTLELVSQGYWWPQPCKLAKEFVKSCDTCARSKASHHRPYILLQPLAIPKRPWASLSMDFIIDLPLVGGYDSVVFMVHRFTKMAHFDSCAKTISGEETTDLFFTNVVRLHGLQFFSNF